MEAKIIEYSYNLTIILDDDKQLVGVVNQKYAVRFF